MRKLTDNLALAISFSFLTMGMVFSLIVSICEGYWWLSTIDFILLLMDLWYLIKYYKKACYVEECMRSDIELLKKLAVIQILRNVNIPETKESNDEVEEHNGTPV